MNIVPHRPSLAAHVAEILRAGLGSGQWVDHLPGERVLCARLQVSRPTLRAALAQLETEGLIASAHGLNRRILRRHHGRKGARVSVVGLLSPQPLHVVPPFVLYWIDEVRNHLAEAGYTLEVRVSPSCFRRNPGTALKATVRQHPAACWVLFLSTAEMQRWFSDAAIPCLVAGSCHAGVRLPSVDVDYHATCRHAAGLFLSRGHQRAALLVEAGGLAGDRESAAGFREAFAAARHTDGAIILEHDGSRESLCAQLRHSLQLRPPPTGFLVAKSHCALAAMGVLIECGLRPGRDVALMARDDDEFLSWTAPQISRYVVNPALFARKVSRAVIQLACEGYHDPRRINIFSRLISAETLCPAPGPAGLDARA